MLIKKRKYLLLYTCVIQRATFKIRKYKSNEKLQYFISIFTQLHGLWNSSWNTAHDSGAIRSLPDEGSNYNARN